jgi:small nuclear ribonucleoprotein G
MSKASQPELKKVSHTYRLPITISFTLYLIQFMDKKLFVHLQGGRKVSGILRGYDLFLNLVLDDCLEESTAAQKFPIGTVVSLQFINTWSIHLIISQVIRGNSVTSMETLEATRS